MSQPNRERRKIGTEHIRNGHRSRAVKHHILRYIADARLFHALSLWIGEGDASGVGNAPQQRFEQGRFSRAVAPDDRHDLAVMYIQGDIVNNHTIAFAHRQPPDLRTTFTLFHV